MHRMLSRVAHIMAPVGARCIEPAFRRDLLLKSQPFEWQPYSAEAKVACVKAEPGHFHLESTAWNQCAPLGDFPRSTSEPDLRENQWRPRHHR
jgi:hypothetical protein